MVTDLFIRKDDRKVKDIFAIVDKIHELGADIKSLKEEWLDTTTPTGKLLFTFIAGISQCIYSAEVYNTAVTQKKSGLPQ